MSNISFSQNYSIKKRWTINTSYSLYQIWETKSPFIMTEEQFNDPNYFVQQVRSNVRLNVNYGILNCLEIGGYIGFMCYPVCFVPDRRDTNLLLFLTSKEFLAPTFGINVNFHLFPLLKINPRNRWDLYLCAKYGGCYLTTYNNSQKYFIPVSGFNYHKDELNPYRHEYGVGIGGSVFFWNLIGFNTEFSYGQFSYWSRMFSSNYNLRVGIILELNANHNKIIIK